MHCVKRNTTHKNDDVIAHIILASDVVLYLSKGEGVMSSPIEVT